MHNTDVLIEMAIGKFHIKARQLLIAACCLVVVSGVEATPMVFGANAYEFVLTASPPTWQASKTASEASIFNGVNGHLATVTSQSENDFLIGMVSLFQGFNGAWLGGDYQGWLTGPEDGKTFAQVGGYTNWNTAEPNNAGLMYMSIGTSTPNSGGAGAGKWLDDSGVQGAPSNADPVIGYFVEYENAAAVAEPATWMLLALSLVGIGFSRRKVGAA